MAREPVDVSLQVRRLFVTRHETDSSEAIFHRTVRSAGAMLWVLGAAEETLAALYDVIEAATGEEGLHATLTARLQGAPDGLA
jgi:hypothetical protein